MTSPCFRSLKESQRLWIALFRAVAGRDARSMARHASEVMRLQELNRDATEYLLAAAMAGHVALGEGEAAADLWRRHRDSVARPDAPAFRLLQCHADGARCVADFRQYGER